MISGFLIVVRGSCAILRNIILMVIKHMEETEMCQASTDFAPTKTESDDEFKWEEFFGKSCF